MHALLGDASRYVVAIAAYHTEREVDLIDMLVPALRRHGRPDSLYLDYVPGHVIRQDHRTTPDAAAADEMVMRVALSVNVEFRAGARGGLFEAPQSTAPSGAGA